MLGSTDSELDWQGPDPSLPNLPEPISSLQTGGHDSNGCCLGLWGLLSWWTENSQLLPSMSGVSCLWLLPPLLRRGRVWQGQVGSEQDRRSSLDGNPRGPTHSSPLQGLSLMGTVSFNRTSCQSLELPGGSGRGVFAWLLQLALDSSGRMGGRSLSITEMDIIIILLFL